MRLSLNLLGRLTYVVLIASLSACRKDGVTEAQLRTLKLDCYHTPVTLVQGKGEAEGTTCAIVTTVFGDLDNDGHADAAIITRSSSGGSGAFYELHPVLWSKSGPVVNEPQLLGDRIDVKNLTYVSDHVRVRMLAQGPNDGACCPTQDVSDDYWWDGKRMTTEKPPPVIQAGGVILTGFRSMQDAKIRMLGAYYGHFVDGAFGGDSTAGKRAVLVCYVIFNDSKTPQEWTWQTKALFDGEGRMFAPLGGSPPSNIQPLDSAMLYVRYVIPTGVNMSSKLEWGRRAIDPSQYGADFKLPIRAREVIEYEGALTTEMNELSDCIRRGQSGE